ncbi:MAG: ImpA family metalloprotease [Pseudomonadota bacterium]
MIRKIGLASLAILAAACSGGGSNSDGDLPDTPPIGDIPPSQANAAPIVSTKQVRAQTGENFVANVAIVDADGDPVSLSLIDGPDWISLTPDGQLTGTPSTDDIGTFEVILDASDGIDTTRATIELTLFMDPIEQAMMTGDFTYISEHSDTAFETIVLDEIEAVRARNRQAIIDIYELNADGTANANSVTGLDWAPPSTSAHFTTRYPYSFPLIISNQRDGGAGENMAIIGEAGPARYALFANNPASMGEYDAEQPNSRLFKNTIDWIVQTDTSESFDVVLAQMPGSFSHDRTVELLDAAFPDKVSANDFAACDSNRFADCMTDELDLIIVFQNIGSAADQEAVIEQMRMAMDRGVAVLFVRRFFNDDNDAFAGRVHSLLQSGGSGLFYPHYVGIHGGGGLNVLGEGEPEYVAALETLLIGLRDDTLDYDLSVCVDDAECPQNNSYRQEVYSPLTAVRSALATLTNNVGDPFENFDQNRFAAALALTGDYYRSQTRFPMPKATTPSDRIIRALFGEYANAKNRNSIPVMPDMGTYSRTNFEDAALDEVTVTLAPTTTFRSTGLYALPGQPISVTRTDTGNNSALIQIHSLDESLGAPFHTFDGTEYSRPTSISRHTFQIARALVVAGNGTSAELPATIEFKPIYGGPIHVYPRDATDEVTLTFSNVAQAPVWRRPEDNEAFAVDLAADLFDWAEILTPSFEVHSTVEKLNASLDTGLYISAADLAQATFEYLNDWPRWLDGQSGDGVRSNDDLQGFLDAHDLQLEASSSAVRHFIADRARCEPTCFGNPITSSEAFSPMDYDVQATVATPLANALDGLSGPHVGAVTDLHAIHSYFRWFQDTNVAISACPQLPHQAIYERLQAGYTGSEGAANIALDDVSGQAEQSVFYVQLLAALQAQNAFDDGWAFWPRFSVVMRALRYADTGARWPDWSSSLGFADLDHATFRDWQNDDRRVVLLSWAAQRDLTAHFEMWGYEVTEVADAHMSSLNLPPLEPAFYAIPETGHCTSLTHAELPIDGVSTWP